MRHGSFRNHFFFQFGLDISNFNNLGSSSGNPQMKKILKFSKPGLGHGFKDSQISPRIQNPWNISEVFYLKDRFFLILGFPRKKRKLSFIPVDVACLF